MDQDPMRRVHEMERAARERALREEAARKRHPAYVAAEKARQAKADQAPKRNPVRDEKVVRGEHPAYPKKAPPSRRNLLKMLAATGLVAGATVLGAGRVTSKPEEAEAPPAPLPESEPLPEFPTFAERTARLRESFTTYRPNYIFLLTASGERVGEPIEVVDMPNALSPDIPELGDADASLVNRDWLAARYHAARLPMPADGQPLCEVEKMSLIDRIRHFGADPAKGAALHISESLLKHVREHINEAAEKIHDPWIQSRLPTIIPALIGIESNFDNRAVSPTGPRGIVQYTRNSWRDIWHMLGRRGNPDRFADQLTFLGAHLHDTHRSFTHARRAKDCIQWVETNLFANESICKQFFAFPSLITAYNRGTPVMLDVMEWFVLQSKLLEENHPSALKDLSGQRSLSFHDLKAAAQDGHELFYLMVANAAREVPGFNDEAAGYFAKIYALEGPLAELQAS